jgi:hypothetical protein
MALLRKITFGVAALALLATSLTPAFARGGGGYGGGYGWGNSWGGGGYGGHRRHHGRGDNDTAEVLGGVLLGAILVGVIASASKKSKQARRDSGENYPQRDARYPGDNPPSVRNSSGRIASEDQAVDACAAAAEEREGRSSSVRDITEVRSSSDGWDVEGVIENRDNWRDKSGSKHNFTCSVRAGNVETVYVEGRTVAYNDQDEYEAAN